MMPSASDLQHVSPRSAVAGPLGSGLLLLVMAMLVLLAWPGQSSAEMTRPVSLSAGSFFAAGLACERHDRIGQGQIATILSDLDKYLSPRNKRWLKEGFDKGLKTSKVFIPERGWIDSVADESECYRVQSVLDEYRSILGAN
jgi:hypothetical protein